MTGLIVHLNSTWTIGDRIGDRSGFAEVYEATAENGEHGAAKFIPKEPGAKRELLFETLSGVPNVVPILDSGETDSHYLIVMPTAVESLRAHLNRLGGKLPPAEAVVILTDIAWGLSSLEANVVHRDLKPENVLLLDGKWCLADFGIARYAEASTEAETRKHVKSLRYAAPEQWRGERATNRADVYAFGIIAYELIVGLRPFEGPDFRDQHLNETPPPIKSGFRALDSMISDCLMKSAAARPTPAILLSRLGSCLNKMSPAAESLRQLHGQMAEQAAANDASVSAARTTAETRAELAKDAANSLKSIIRSLIDAVVEAAPNANVSEDSAGVSVGIGSGRLTIPSVQMARAGILEAGSYYAPFDVVAYTSIDVRQNPSRSGSEGRSHSLWYCDAQEKGDYKWFELSFRSNGFLGGSMDPFALGPADNAMIAFIPVTGTVELSWPPVAIDYESEEEFLERWLRWFTAAAGGRYQSPSYSPDFPHGRQGGFRPARPKR